MPAQMPHATPTTQRRTTSTTLSKPAGVVKTTRKARKAAKDGSQLAASSTAAGALSKSKAEAQKKPKPLPLDPLDRLNVLRQRLGLPAPNIEVVEHRQYLVRMSCPKQPPDQPNPTAEDELDLMLDFDDEALRADGDWCNTQKEAKRSAAEVMNAELEKMLVNEA